MKRDFLKDLGIEGDVIKQIMDENGKDVEEAKKGIEDLKQQVASKDTEISGLREQIAQRDADIEALRTASADNESLKTQLTELQAKYSTDTAELQQKLRDQATEFETSKATEAFFNGVEFSSQLAREAAIAQFKSKDFKLENGTFQGGKEWLEELRKNSPDAFKAVEADPAISNPQQPYFTKNINPANSAPAATPPGGGGNPFGGWNFQQVRNFDKK